MNDNDRTPRVTAFALVLVVQRMQETLAARRERLEAEVAELRRSESEVAELCRRATSLLAASIDDERRARATASEL